jgi:hypothetical protein
MSERRAEFLSRLVLERAGVPDSGEWVNVGAFGFYSAERKREFWVPDRSPTDLASVPKLPILYWLCGGRADEPAVLHDHGYRSGLFGTRAEVDALFAEAMRVVSRLKQEALEAKGAGRARRWYERAKNRAKDALEWAGVRMGGHWSYKDRAGTLSPPAEPVAP